MAPARPRLELLLPLLLLLLGPARGLPLLRPDWPGCRDAARRLNHLVRELDRPQPLVELQEQEPGQDPTPRIRCSDGCDPGALSTDSSHCLDRIRQGLQHYRALLGSEVFAGCPHAPDVENALVQLSRLLERPGEGDAERWRATPQTSPLWEHSIVQHRTLRQLQAFSAVVARVFAHGATLR